MIINADSLEYLKTMADCSVDAIITDPPYLYLDHKLDAMFDEQCFFELCYKKIKEGGILLFFGRGFAFYRWNVICEKLGFDFKEEIIWDKTATSSPLMNVGRRHETISILSKGDAVLNKIFINVEDIYDNQEYKILLQDINRMIATLKKIDNLDDLKSFKDGDFLIGERKSKHNITAGNSGYRRDAGFGTYQKYERGTLFPTVIKFNREHYSFEHPTQKPIKLMEHLIQLVSKEGDTILDPFMGSGTTGIACFKTGREFIGIEIDSGYYDIAKNRIESSIRQLEIL